jgi:hypothetical protein
MEVIRKGLSKISSISVIFGRFPFADAIANGRVQVEGEQELTRAFEQRFQGI